MGLGLYETGNKSKEAMQGYSDAGSQYGGMIRAKNAEPKEKEKTIGGGLMSAAGGAASGAMVGAELGMVGGPLGAGIGAGVGALAYALG